MKITEKNIDMVNGRLKKFFRWGCKFYEWYTFSSKKCMSKGKVSTKEDNFLYLNKRKTHKRVFTKLVVRSYRFYKDSKEIEIIFSDSILGFNESNCYLTIGDEILFKGNRIVIKQKGTIYRREGKDYEYICYQILR